MEKITARLASSIARSLGYDREKEAVIAYGLFAITQTVLTVFVTLLAGLAVGAPLESMIVCFSVSLYRKYSGGAHANTALACAAVTVTYCTAAALVAKWLAPLVNPPWLALPAILLIYLVAYWITYRYAPVDSPNKPIKTEKKIQRMRKGSFTILTMYLAFQLFFYVYGIRHPAFFSAGLSLLLGTGWQAFTLTPIGSILLHPRNVQPNHSGKEVSK